MAYLVSQCRSRVFLSGLLTRTSLAAQIWARTAMTRSLQYPDYSVIFSLEEVQSASKVNRTKLHSTLVLAVSTPALFVASNLDYISPEFFEGFTFWGTLGTVFLHSIGFLFNNVIGFVYIKDDNESVKISHIDYWGERVDVDTTIDDIYELSESSPKLTNALFHTVRLVNSNKKYKLYLPPGKVLDEKIFTAIFGQSR